MEQDTAKASGVESASIFTRVKGVIFSGAKVWIKICHLDTCSLVLLFTPNLNLFTHNMRC